MKKSLLFTVLWVAFSWCVNGQLVNGDFETGDKTPWQGFNNGMTVAADETTIDYCYSGDFSGKINNGEGSLFQVLDVVAGAQYTLTFYGKLRDAGQSFNAVVKDELAGGKPLIGSVAVNADAWTPYSVNFTAPAQGKVRVLFYKANGIGPFYVDDVTFGLATAIESTEINTFSVAPNPSSGLFKINGTETITGYTVYNAAGQVVKEATLSNQEVSVDLSGKPHGLYLVQVNSISGKSEILKVLVK
ncbi:MAG: carbohydrate binding domain-containing protein [Marinilabiliaceae bacterium]|nr:carbohydrate binding domain-containing protein [Marinilabiliaceae bacterium]